jgi:uncharacterized metal-binding protein
MSAGRRDDRPTLVYACSGSSNVAQLANAIAVRLDRTGRAEMSCIAGVGGDVGALVRKATSGRRIVAIDGCPLGCCAAALARHGVEPDRQIALHERGFRKRLREDVGADEREAVIGELLDELDELLEPPTPPRRPTAGRTTRVPTAA